MSCAAGFGAPLLPSQITPGHLNDQRVLQFDLSDWLDNRDRNFHVRVRSAGASSQSFPGNRRAHATPGRWRACARRTSLGLGRRAVEQPAELHRPRGWASMVCLYRARRHYCRRSFAGNRSRTRLRLRRWRRRRAVRLGGSGSGHLRRRQSLGSSAPRPLACKIRTRATIGR